MYLKWHKSCDFSLLLQMAVKLYKPELDLHRYLIFLTISLDEMLKYVIVEGSFNADSFVAFINSLLDSM